jgi:alkanesulfonate monooxygenase
MTLAFHWFLPTYGDSRFIVGGGHGQRAGLAAGDRRASIGYLSSIVRAAEELGFVGALTPTGAWCEDAWLTTAMLARESERLAFLVAFRPGLISPTLAAQMAATFSLHAPGRLLLNVVTGGEAHEQRAYGDHLSKDERYARCAEFLDVVRRLCDRRDGHPPWRTPGHRRREPADAPGPGPAAVLRRLVRRGRTRRRRAR